VRGGLAAGQQHECVAQARIDSYSTVVSSIRSKQPSLPHSQTTAMRATGAPAPSASCRLSQVSLEPDISVEVFVLERDSADPAPEGVA
jgi:hypothetical protein